MRMKEQKRKKDDEEKRRVDRRTWMLEREQVCKKVGKDAEKGQTRGNIKKKKMRILEREQQEGRAET